jgi:hypothetical protein
MSWNDNTTKDKPAKQKSVQSAGYSDAYTLAYPLYTAIKLSRALHE